MAFLPSHSHCLSIHILSLSLISFLIYGVKRRLGIWFTLHRQPYQELEWFSLIRINWVISHFGSDGYELGPSTKPKYYRYIYTWFIVIASKWNMRKQSISHFCYSCCFTLFLSIDMFIYIYICFDVLFYFIPFVCVFEYALDRFFELAFLTLFNGVIFHWSIANVKWLLVLKLIKNFFYTKLIKNIAYFLSLSLFTLLRNFCV